MAMAERAAQVRVADFRAAERTFQLVTQAAGRVGRGERPGIVAVQTARPDHEAIRAAVSQDHPSFADAELRFRKAFRYPPYTHLLLALFAHLELPKAHGAAGSAFKALASAEVAREIRILGPAPAPLERLKGFWRYHLVIKAERREAIEATLPMPVASERGRTEYVMVSVVEGEGREPIAYPTGKGSGAVTAFGQADGFFSIGSHTEMVPAGTRVAITLIGSHPRTDLVVMGSHCVGLDLLVGHLVREGLSVKAIHVGSMGGLAAARRGECDVAGIHLMDAASGEYNRPFLSEALELVQGYRRLQGVVFRRGDARFDGRDPSAAVGAALSDAECVMINRNPGSGTRILIDRLLGDARPRGYTSQAKTHSAVAVAVAQGRADWGLAIETVAREYGLDFLPLQPEQYDFVVPRSRLRRAPVQRFLALLAAGPVRAELERMGFGAGP